MEGEVEMKFKHLLTIGLTFVIMFSFCATSQAYLSRVYADVWTTNYTDDQQLNVWLEMWGTEEKNPPDIVNTIEVTAPDGTKFNMTTDQNWLPYDRGYWGRYRDADFMSGSIPAGVYKVKVVPKAGLGFPIEVEDEVDATFLSPPTITSPAPGAVVGPTPTFLWTAVPDATHYRILLYNESWGEPVFWFWWNRKFFTDLPGAKIPLGQLKPNCEYSLRIEARSGVQDLDKRSRSDWLIFYTGSWSKQSNSKDAKNNRLMR